MPKQPVCGTDTALPDLGKMHVNAAYLGDALDVFDELAQLHPTTTPFVALCAAFREIARSLCQDLEKHIDESRRAAKVPEPIAQTAKPARHQAFNALLELEGQIHGIENLTQALDMIVEEISGYSTHEPMPQRTRSALMAVHEALRKQARVTVNYVDDHYSLLRRGG